MAYKFQLGAANLSGSITQTSGAVDANATTVDSLDVSSGGITNAGAIAGATTIDASGDLTVGTITMSEFTVAANGNTDIDGTLNVEGVPTFQAGAVFSSGITTANAIAGATTIAASGLSNLNGGIEVDSGGNKFTVSTAGVVSGSSNLMVGGNITGSGGISLVDASGLAGTNLEDDGSGALQIAASAAGTGLTGGGSEALSLDVNELSEAAIANGDFIVIEDATDNSTKKEAIADVATLFAGAGMTATNAVLNVIGGDGITANANDVAVTAAQTTITSVLNNSLKLGYGASDAFIDFSTDNEINFAVDNTTQVVVDDGTFHPETDDDVSLGTSAKKFKNLFLAGTASIAGDLVVQGTTVTLDVATVGITGSFSFEGATADDFETTLGVIDPTADRTINLPNQSGTIPLLAAVSATQISATPEELNFLDAGTAGSSATVVGADSIIIGDSTNGNATKKVLVSDIQSSAQNLGAMVAVDLNGASDGDTITMNSSNAGKVHLCNTFGGDKVITLQLPSIAAGNVGEQYRIKMPSDAAAGARLLEIAVADGGDLIDGAASILLESPHAAVNLIVSSATTFSIF